MIHSFYLFQLNFVPLSFFFGGLAVVIPPGYIARRVLVVEKSLGPILFPTNASSLGTFAPLHPIFCSSWHVQDVHASDRETLRALRGLGLEDGPTQNVFYRTSLLLTGGRLILESLERLYRTQRRDQASPDVYE